MRHRGKPCDFEYSASLKSAYKKAKQIHEMNGGLGSDELSSLTKMPPAKVGGISYLFAENR
jgi:hypothetical protein